LIRLSTENWTLDNVKTVLFDKDGTFIDLHYFWGKMTELRCEEIIRIFEINPEKFEDLCFELGYDVKHEKMLPDGITALYSRVTIIKIFRERLEKFSIFTTEEKLTEIFDYVNTIFYKNITEYTRPIESAVIFIKKLHEMGVKLAVVTSDSLVSTNLTLKYFGWDDLFGAVVGRESACETKESGALTKIALNALDADPETTIMIGDAPMDYLAAKNAGVNRTILVATGQIEESLLKQSSNYTVASLNDLSILKI